MEKQGYTIRFHKKTSELHVFLGVFDTTTRVFTPEKLAVCHDESVGKDDTTLVSEHGFFEFDDVGEQRLRMYAAETLKREACGNCIATFYSTKD